MMQRLIGSYELRILLAAAAAAALAIVGVCFTLVVRANQTQAFREQSSLNCQSIEQIKSDIRGTFAASRMRLVERTDLDPAQKTAALKSLDEELVRYAPDDCPDP